ncbi:MAG: type II toxin-antitoxin system HicB family antitoxin [Treponema sp.]|jgi:predicted HicB family RNase H-like nuclease|nr:type II toxin-antitoxin system HicB family antitoxin [Treponema sp.]
MKNTLNYKGYFGSVEFSEEDNIFHGRIIGINDHITYHGKCAESLRGDFMEAVNDYLETCAEMGKEPEKAYKGTFNVRIEPTLHRQLVVYSLSQGKSLNATVQEAINSYIN